MATRVCKNEPCGRRENRYPELAESGELQRTSAPQNGFVICEQSYSNKPDDNLVGVGNQPRLDMRNRLQGIDQWVVIMDRVWKASANVKCDMGRRQDSTARQHLNRGCVGNAAMTVSVPQLNRHRATSESRLRLDLSRYPYSIPWYLFLSAGREWRNQPERKQGP